ncbi:hypothetical protein J6590_012025 [Homalodisca vitripennis]|nr:hypothetical protein J6590_012025 [Homalodisca vitripennis]
MTPISPRVPTCLQSSGSVALPFMDSGRVIDPAPTVGELPNPADLHKRVLLYEGTLVKVRSAGQRELEYESRQWGGRRRGVAVFTDCATLGFNTARRVDRCSRHSHLPRTFYAVCGLARALALPSCRESWECTSHRQSC